MTARVAAGGPLGSGSGATRSRDASRGGFVLAFVVLLLFSIAVASATGYMIVNSEFGMAKHSSDGAEALTVARAGLERFIAEQIGVVDDTVVYALGDGIAEVTSRKLLARDSVTDFYYIRSEATVTDIFAPSSPARRVVGATAIHRRRPLPHHAVFTIAANQVNVNANASGSVARGNDHNSSANCSGGGASAIPGVVARVSVTELNSTDIQGTPQWEIWPGGSAAVRDSIKVRWDILSDPDFPLEFDGTWPNFGSLPADSFPVVRHYGWLSTNIVGRGVLIVVGTFDPTPSFVWDGIVLAQHADDYLEGTIRGTVVAGLDGPNSYSTVNANMNARYYSCSVYAANESLSYLELVEHTVHEVN
jgi:hypothetical protein